MTHVAYSSQKFEERYTYTGHDLGCTWAEEKTTFRLWAPLASAVEIALYSGGVPGKQDCIRRLAMVPGERGTWYAEETGNLNGLYYTYLVTNPEGTTQACDPYAKATGVNGQRAMILDMRATNPDGWDTDRDPHFGQPITDAVLYELHIRDFSMDPDGNIPQRGTYTALTCKGTKTTGGHATGLDHIVALGVTHVHLMPIYDYGFTDEASPAPAYNWGYDPVNFNVPEGSYSTDAFNGSVRVKELKDAIQTLHKSGISVVLDVVYNHVWDAGTFCFNRIVPGYFSRIDENGRYSNGSCCGNDTASERSMVRKYIVDSVNYWAEEYHIDGFRFDLVGLLDTETIRQIISSVHQRHPNVLFYGEGWTMDTQPTKANVQLCIQENSGSVPGFAFFNDTLRDLMRGSVFYQDQPGFVAGAQSDKILLEQCFLGMPSWAAQPEQCINYVSCHDNNTLFDRLALTAPNASRQERIDMNRLAAAYTILSQGIPFLMAGEELLRTKPGKSGGFDENSYRSADSVNAIKWGSLDNPEVQQVLRYYKGLLALRKAHPALRLRTQQDVCKAVSSISLDDAQAVAFSVKEKAGTLLIAFYAGSKPLRLSLPEGHWDILVNKHQAGTCALGQAEEEILLPPVSANVLWQQTPANE